MTAMAQEDQLQCQCMGVLAYPSLFLRLLLAVRVNMMVD